MPLLTPEEIRQRQSDAVIKLESLVGLLHTFVHGTANETVTTNNGPIPTLAGITGSVGGKLEQHELEIGQILTDITASIDGLAEV